MSGNGKHTRELDFLIIGAGPAGLQLGYGLERTGSDYVVLEASSHVASFFRTMPRFGRLISFNKCCSIYDDPEIALRFDWNSLLCDGELLFKDFSRDLYPSNEAMVRYLEAFAARFVPRIELNAKVACVDRPQPGGRFEVHTADGRCYRPRVVVCATGFAQPFVPQIDGIELVTETYANVDLNAEAYFGQRVLIIGKGNSAFEVAEHLLSEASLIHVASPRPVRFAWTTRHAGHLRAHYTRLLDTYQLKLLNSVLDCSVDRIARDDGGYRVTMTYAHAEGEVDELRYDRVILCTGFRSDLSIFAPACAPSTVIDDRFPALDAFWQAANVPDLYFAGTLMQSRDFQRAATAFIDGFRYNIRTLFHVLLERYAGRPYPSRTWPATPQAMVSELLPWICRSSGLWAQFGYLCDVVIIDDAAGTAHYMKELPVDALREAPLSLEPHVYQITFEWGPWEGDVFAIDRRPRHEAAHQSAFLHPVIRRLRFGEVVEEHHMLEDLYGMWSAGHSNSVVTHSGQGPHAYHDEQHVRPLSAFFARQLNTPRLEASAPTVNAERSPP